MCECSDGLSPAPCVGTLAPLYAGKLIVKLLSQLAYFSVAYYEHLVLIAELSDRRYNRGGSRSEHLFKRSVMCGGKKETFDKYYDLLMAMAGSVVYVGPIGSGNVAKLANQMVVACNIAAVAEALTFAKKAGTDPELVYQAIRGGLAGSTVMDAKAPMMLAGNYKPGFRIELHIEDLNNVLNAAHAINMPVPMAAQMMEIMQNLKTFGGEKEDHSSMVKYYERISGVSIVKED